MSWNVEQRSARLQLRLNDNSWKTSFDFKTLLFDSSMNSMKIPQSSMKLRSIKFNRLISNSNDSDDSLSNQSSDDEFEEKYSPTSPSNRAAEDNRLAELAAWEPDKLIESSEEEEEVEEEIHSINHEEFLPEKSIDEEFHLSRNSPVEDLLVTYVHQPIKIEPILPQIDGQTDLIITEQKPISKSKVSPIRKRRRLKGKRSYSMEVPGRTLHDYFQVIKRSSTNFHSPTKTSNNRPANYFDNCIVIDDEEMEEETNVGINSQYSVLANNIATREKLLDHAIRTSSMRVKWLRNMELLLLEHISIYHDKHLRTSTNSSLHASFISILITNFSKIFLIHSSNDHQDELAFHQFGLTFYLRYFLLELPTYQHRSIHEENDCSECEQYSQILRELFDLLFDRLEFDLCQISIRDHPRSSLLEEDYYFHQYPSTNQSSFDRIKLLIYLIELIGLHRYRCPQSKNENILRNENQFFHWMDDFLRHLFRNPFEFKQERLTICFNVIDLCLIFVRDRHIHIEQIVVFLAELCEENPEYFSMIVFDRNLSSDIRLCLIDRLIFKKFHIRLTSNSDLEKFFHSLQMELQTSNSIDAITLGLIHSLFNTLTDLNSSSIFRHQLDWFYNFLLNLSQQLTNSEQIQRTVIFLRLLQCKYNRVNMHMIHLSDYSSSSSNV